MYHNWTHYALTFSCVYCLSTSTRMPAPQGQQTLFCSLHISSTKNNAWHIADTQIFAEWLSRHYFGILKHFFCLLSLDCYKGKTTATKSNHDHNWHFFFFSSPLETLLWTELLVLTATRFSRAGIRTKNAYIPHLSLWNGPNGESNNFKFNKHLLTIML